MMKAQTFTQAQVLEQIQGLNAEKIRLEREIAKKERDVKALEQALKENHVLEERLKSIRAENHALFAEEWKRHSEFYPDLWLFSMTYAQKATPDK